MSTSLSKSSHLIASTVKPWGNFNFLSWVAGQVVGPHVHDFLQTIHVLAGELQVDWGAGWRRLGPGDVHILPPNHTHAVRTPTGHRQFGLNFSSDPDDRGVLTALLQKFTVPLVLAVPFRHAWTTCLPGQGQRGTLGALRQLHALEDYAIALLEAGMPQEETAMAGRLVAFLEEHTNRPVAVPDVATALHISRATLQRLCQRHFGCGVAHLHERLRLEDAAAALVREDLTVGEVAERSGYGDIYQFSRAFKRVYGLSPTAFRQRARTQRV